MSYPVSTFKEVNDYSMTTAPLRGGGTGQMILCMLSKSPGIQLFDPCDDQSDEAIGIDWSEVNAVVQSELARLTQEVLDTRSEARWESGRSSSRAFALFSYRVFFHLDGNDYDPIVVGITFSKRPRAIHIEGDISGDESGYVYFDDDCSIDVEPRAEAVIKAAIQIAINLAAQVEIVLHAIAERHPRAIPS